MRKLSAVISAYNEEDKIEKCLSSLKFCDEIIVVDNESTDRTVEKAKKYTSKIFSQKNNPSAIDLLKNLGFEKATNDWILSIDADEEVSKELSEEIQKKLKEHIPEDINGFLIPRKNFIFRKWIEHCGWYPDPQLRLFKKGKGKFIKKHVHESIMLEGESGQLKEHIIHKNYDSVNQFIKKTFIYAPNEAEEMLRKGYKFSYFDVISFPLKEFLSRFFARKGYKDGMHGLVLSILMAFYHFLIFAYIWEKNGFKEYDRENFLTDMEEEFKKAGKDILYWISKEKLDSIRSPIGKNLAKLANKLRKN